MAFRVICLLFSLLALSNSEKEAPEWRMTTDFQHNVQLGPEGVISLFWHPEGDSPDSYVLFEIQAKTLGYVGIGLSPNAGMPGADIVIVGVDDDGNGYISDRFATENGFPKADKQQDYELLSSKQNDTHTVIRYRRKLQTCDPDDWIINNSTVRVIWAFHEKDFDGDSDFPKHEFKDRGARSLHLLSATPDDSVPLPENVKTFDLRVKDVQIPNEYHTLYMCKIFRMPDLGKHHMIKWEPIVSDEVRPYLHHIVVYACPHDMGDYVDRQEACFDPSNPTNSSTMHTCQLGLRQLLTWVAGGTGTTLPPTMGYPILEEGSNPYYLLEVHYDNAAFHKDLPLDNSGIKLYMVPDLRPVEVGYMTIGTGASPATLIIPPQQPSFTITTFCDFRCTKTLPADGIHVISVELHEHTASKAVKVRHIRDGVELPIIFEDKYFDWAYEDMRSLQQPVKIMPNDTVIVECIYNTAGRDGPTFGGPGTTNEMCFVFFDYYPRSDQLVSCISGPEQTTYANAMGASVVEHVPEQIFVSDPTNNDAPIKIDEFATKRDWTSSDGSTDDASKAFMDAVNAGSHYEWCYGAKDDRVKDLAHEKEYGTESIFESVVQDTLKLWDNKFSLRQFEKLSIPEPKVPLVEEPLCSERPLGDQSDPKPEPETNHVVELVEPESASEPEGIKTHGDSTVASRDEDQNGHNSGGLCKGIGPISVALALAVILLNKQ